MPSLSIRDKILGIVVRRYYVVADVVAEIDEEKMTMTMTLS